MVTGPSKVKDSSNHPANISALVLAAGTSSRMDQHNKLLMKIDGRSLIQSVLETVDASCIDSCHVVTGHEHTLLEEEINAVCAGMSLNCTQSKNMNYKSGMGSTVVEGFSTLSQCDAVVVCLGDMPFISANAINSLVTAYLGDSNKSIFVSCFKQRRGNPVLVANSMFESVLNITGDVGVRSIIAKNPDTVLEVDTDCKGVLEDFDTPMDFIAQGQPTP